jgi:DNA-binding LacI/PurR family transcriptional regulator
MTLKTLSQQLNLSVTTVAEALKEEPTIHLSAATRERVRQAADDLGYRPNVHARRLVKRRAEDVVGLFCSNLAAGGAGMEKLTALQKWLTAFGFEVPMMLGSTEAPHRHGELFSALCRTQPAALVWLFSSWSDTPDLSEYARSYVRRGGILVCLDKETDLPADNVIFDREQNSYLPARHLLSLRHRKIGIFLDRDQWPDSPRAEGIRRAFAEFGLTATGDALTVFAPGSGPGFAAGAAVADEFLALPHGRRPTGVVLLNDATAAAFMSRVMDAGVRVPDEVSVAGHDDMSYSPYLRVPLTTVTHPSERVATAAAEIVRARLKEGDRAPHHRVLISSELVIRASTCSPAA